MVATPLVVRNIVGSGFTAFTSTLSPIVGVAMVSAKAQALRIAKTGKNLMGK